MDDASPIRCFQCGHDVGDPPRLNRRPDGRLCPACHDRVLEAVPAALPGAPVREGVEQRMPDPSMLPFEWGEDPAEADPEPPAAG